MRLFKLAFIAIFFSLVAPAHAAGPVPLVNYTDVVVTTGSGKAPTLDQVKQTIIAAGNARRWTFADQGNNQLIGSLSWGAHTMLVTIAYTPQNYSITYRDSINLKYGMEDGKPVIHPRYNTYVQELMTRFRIGFAKL